MTAITLNLLAEEQFAQRAESRDPFKVVLAIGIGLFALAVLAGIIVGHMAEKRGREADVLQRSLDSLATGQSGASGGDTKTVKSMADDIVAINQSRQLYAKQLALIKDLVPNAIELTRINFSLGIDTQDTAPEESEAATRGEKNKVARLARPKVTQHLSLQLEGRAICSRPEIEVDQYIQTLRSDATFGSYVKDIRLRSIARGGFGGSSETPGAASVSFVISCQYK